MRPYTIVHNLLGPNREVVTRTPLITIQPSLYTRTPWIGCNYSMVKMSCNKIDLHSVFSWDARLEPLWHGQPGSRWGESRPRDDQFAWWTAARSATVNTIFFLRCNAKKIFLLMKTLFVVSAMRHNRVYRRFGMDDEGGASEVREEIGDTRRFWYKRGHPY
jgi:hypothetical protein